MKNPIADQLAGDVRRLLDKAREQGHAEGYRVGRYDARAKYLSKIGVFYLLGCGSGAAFVVLAIAWWPK